MGPASRQLLDDAGLTGSDVNGIVATGIAESDQFTPATLAEYLGIPINFGEVVDLGGATSAGMVWRAAAAVELGICDAVLAVVPDRPRTREDRGRSAHGLMRLPGCRVLRPPDRGRPGQSDDRRSHTQARDRHALPRRRWRADRERRSGP
jgi:acetyl-CoA acetyltransferase